MPSDAASRCPICHDTSFTHPQGHCYSRVRRWPCDNCGSAHWGMYEGYRSAYRFSGMEVDFLWTNQRGEQKLAPNGERRLPC